MCRDWDSNTQPSAWGANALTPFATDPLRHRRGLLIWTHARILYHTRCIILLYHPFFTPFWYTSVFFVQIIPLGADDTNNGITKSKTVGNEKGGGGIWKLGWYSYHLIFIICQQRPIQLVEKLKWFFASTEKYDYDIICNSAMFKVWNNPALNNFKINVFFVEMHWTLNNNNKSRYNPRKEFKTLGKMRYAHWCSFPTFLANLRRYM